LVGITNTKCVQGAEFIILHKVVYVGLVTNFMNLIGTFI